VTVPQSIDAKLWVHALSEYAPKFAVATTPLIAMVFDETSAPEAIRAANSTAKPIVTADATATFFFFNVCLPLEAPIVNFNR
jgi:hypothetical protein